MFKVKAKFIGTDSVGFIHNNIYEMILIDLPHIGKGLIQIEARSYSRSGKKTRLRCEYNNWESFIPNWEIFHYENMTGDHDAEVHHNKVNSELKSEVRNNKISKVLKNS
jgi:hypothetical protein